ncbi:MAG: hypothetical protein R3362_02330 [Rhodothermales bacterium]|nr:hypothetical protein [Rhodothermales bacterium]
MSTITVARKGGRAAIAADGLTTFEDLKLPSAYDAQPSKIIEWEGSYLGVVGYTAHYVVLQSALRHLDGGDLSSREAIFETFRALHPILKEEYYLLTDANEGDPYESTQITLLIANAHGIFGVYDLREVHVYTRYWAMGSGMGYALGAMHASYDRLDARETAAVGVRAGIEFDRDSGPPSVVYEVGLT